MIYADHNATTPCLPEVADLARRLMCEEFGNPSNRASLFGGKAREHLGTAREQVARAIGAHPDEVFFTSGATEAANTIVLGVMRRLMRERPRLLSSAIEHPAVCMPAAFCGEAGADWLELPVDSQGRLDPEALAHALRGKPTALVCIMGANNETGVLQDLPTLTHLAHEHGALVFCDLTQMLGKLPFSVHAAPLDFACFSAHKCYGPKGVGALYKRRGLVLPPLLHGGGQEFGLRSGTENVPGIAGFGLAADRAARELGARRAHLGRLTRLLESLVTTALPEVIVQSAAAERIPGTSLFSHPGLSGNWLPQLGGIVASAGSACASLHPKPSHVLLAMGNSPETAARSVRISLGISNTEAEVRQIAKALHQGALRLL